MTDEEMAWLAGESTRPRAPAPPAEPGEVRGSTTDVEAAAAALGALEDTGGKLPGAPVPAAEPPSDGLDEDTSGRPRGPGRLRIAAAALLVAAAGVVAAWQLGWLSPRPKPPPAPVAKAAPAAAAPAAPTPAEVTPPEAAPPEGTPAAPAEATPGAAAAAAPDEVAPAPAPGPVKRGAGPRTGADRKKPNLRIARKDRRLLDLLEKKGDTAPAAPVETSTLDTGLAELDQPAVERALEENRPAFAVCVTRALKADPKLRVDDRKATLMLTVRPNGTVAKAWVAEADLEGTLLGSCLASAARRVVFPAFQGEALEVSAPLVLGAIR